MELEYENLKEGVFLYSSWPSASKVCFDASCWYSLVACALAGSPVTLCIKPGIGEAQTIAFQRGNMLGTSSCFGEPTEVLTPSQDCDTLWHPCMGPKKRSGLAAFGCGGS